MLFVAWAYFIFLYMDIRLHIKKAKNAVKEREAQIKQYENQMAHLEENVHSSFRQNNEVVNVQISLQDIIMNPLKSISHKYCFATGRHGEFIYLKVCDIFIINYISTLFNYYYLSLERLGFVLAC